ncbi:alpha/beta fold hydrolase [Krasilnikoviella flava]|uniref:Pimeloyl-ACP methyl ester carboxylesterase n=1 Tax=Krasilnikoviella flava TaxID=526729 RepID=A0A1T5KZP8_9MICO|nr:alpha/beta hydrolase [Krasilnikoviella flava]SKC68849.1 Pimeloyl-ACP methyl ester carboxylesterase [Krasilnikoviella flava]
MERAAQGPGAAPVRFVDAQTRTVAAAGVELVYRELGSEHAGGVPLVALTHLGANLDSWDPEVVDPLATDRRVILLGYRGVGSSTGTVRDGFEDMATDAVAAIRSLGLSRVDLFGLSMGGMVAQGVLRLAPDLVDKVVLAGAGPQGGPGLTRMTGVMVRGIARGVTTFTNPTSLLFFTRTRNGKHAAKAYQARLRRRRTGRDGPVTPGVMRAQLRAVNRWGHRPPAPMGFTGPALILHGDSDRMVPSENANALARRFHDAQVRIFPDAGHGVVSQNRRTVTDLAGRFLRR